MGDLRNRRPWSENAASLEPAPTDSERGVATGPRRVAPPPHSPPEPFPPRKTRANLRHSAGWRFGSASAAKVAGGSRTHLRRICSPPPDRQAPATSLLDQTACPRQESNLVLDLRRVACHPPHPEDEISLVPNPPPGSRTRPCGFEGRRASATLAGSVDRAHPLAGSRTPSATFGGSHAVRHTPRDRIRTGPGTTAGFGSKQSPAFPGPPDVPDRARTGAACLTSRNAPSTPRAQRKARESNPHAPEGTHRLATGPGEPYPAAFRSESPPVDRPGNRTPISWVQARCLPVGPAAHRLATSPHHPGGNRTPVARM